MRGFVHMMVLLLVLGTSAYAGTEGAAEEIPLPSEDETQSYERDLICRLVVTLFILLLKQILLV